MNLIIVNNIVKPLTNNRRVTRNMAKIFNIQLVEGLEVNKRTCRPRIQIKVENEMERLTNSFDKLSLELNMDTLVSAFGLLKLSGVSDHETDALIGLTMLSGQF